MSDCKCVNPQHSYDEPQDCPTADSAEAPDEVFFCQYHRDAGCPSNHVPGPACRPSGPEGAALSDPVATAHEHAAEWHSRYEQAAAEVDHLRARERKLVDEYEKDIAYMAANEATLQQERDRLLRYVTKLEADNRRLCERTGEPLTTIGAELEEP